MGEALVVRVPEACRMLACSERTLYRLMARKAIQSFTDGRARKIPVASIHEYVARGIETGGVGQGEGQLELKEKDVAKSKS